jgi:NAD(P)-dependent dehydrogenase (short-subunit alcohol dehydrogenase family)
LTNIIVKKVALVTGANKGIGYEIARQLCLLDFRVFLTARDQAKGLNACKKLKGDGMDVEFLRLDVTDPGSIQQAAFEFKTLSPKLDVLVNNAGILIDKTDILSLDVKTLHNTIATNALGALLVIQAFAPYMEDGGRIINVSSRVGSLKEMGSHSPAYGISKTMMNAVTRQFAAVLRSRGIAVNSMHPGWVKTEMGGVGASRSLEKGAETVIWLATEAPVGLTGKFLQDKKEIDW